jgi:predicted nucleic acid-binding protein
VNLLIDSSIFIAAPSSRSYRQFLNEAIRRQWLLLSSVVVMELNAGFRSQKSRRAFTELHRDLSAQGRIVAVQHEDFLLAGQVLFHISRQQGQLNFKDHFRDGLIAVSAARHGATVVTENGRDFALWREGLRRSGRRLTLQIMNRET